MKIKVFLFLAIILVLITTPSCASADGTIVKPISGDWNWVDQDRQQAFINYQDGVEKLIVEVDIQEESSEAAWIIPVPEEPQEVEVDVVSSLPRFYGQDVMKKVERGLQKITGEAMYPLVIPIVSLGGARDKGLKVEGSSVTVATHLEKAGMTTEVLTAKSSQALYEYLFEKGLEIEEGAISSLDQYIGEDYSFVVSWISSGNLQELKSQERGVFITFSTPKIFYPLVPTSSYGEKVVPISIRVLGGAKPSIYSEIKPYSETTYYTKMEEYKSGAGRAGCKSLVGQLASLLSLYQIEHGNYPRTLKSLETQTEKGKALLEVIKEDCPSFAYQVTSDTKGFTLSVFWGGEKEYFYGTEGSGERKISPPPPELQGFYGNQEAWKGNSNFTKIDIKAPSNKFKEDLWMTPGRPLRALLASFIANFIANFSWISILFLTAILSFLAGGISGLICFGRFRKYAVIGLSNLITIIGVGVVMFFIKKEEKARASKLAFVGLFFIMYIVCLVIAGTLMSLL